MLQFPMVIGGVVPVVNLAGIAAGQLKLTGALLGDIYLGRITKLERSGDRRPQPGLKLPDAAIARGHARRRLGHQLHVHQLPVADQRRVEEPRSAKARR
jgi:hypothetical protein